MTIDERRAELRASGLRTPEIEDLIAAEIVNGVWCDGTVVTDESGRRCVTRAQADRVQRARAAAPLEAEPAPRPSVVVAGLVVGALVLVGGLLVALERE